MKQPLHLSQSKNNPAAFAAMGANRAKERAQDRELELLEMARDSAKRIVELTELVGALQERIAVLESR